MNPAGHREGVVAQEALWQLVASRTGFSVAGLRRPHLAGSLRRAMDAVGLTDSLAYLARLQSDGGALDALVEQVLVGESYFFREPQQCALLRTEILPELRRRAGGQAAGGERRPLRIWSAGCAAGEEPYTLAILLEEAGERDAELLATDLSRRALAQARRGWFRPWSLRSLEPEVVARWFEPEGDGFRLRPSLAGRVSFDRLNLVTDPFPGLSSGVWAMDLIVCRNVLIYFDRDTVRQVAEKLAGSLAPGGWLITGSSDPPLQDQAALEVVARPQGIVYRRPLQPRVPVPSGVWSRPPAPAVPTPDPVPVPLRPQASLAAAPAPISVPPRATLADLETRLRAGAYEEVIRQAALLEHDPAAWALRVRALANARGPAAAAAACAGGLRRHSLDVELHYLLAALLLAEGRDREALEEARRVIYLDRSLVMGHLMMATLLERLGDAPAAGRAWARAGALAREAAEDATVPLGEGVTWGALRRSIERQLRELAGGSTA